MVSEGSVLVSSQAEPRGSALPMSGFLKVFRHIPYIAPALPWRFAYHYLVNKQAAS